MPNHQFPFSLCARYAVYSRLKHLFQKQTEKFRLPDDLSCQYQPPTPFVPSQSIPLSTPKTSVAQHLTQSLAHSKITEKGCFLDKLSKQTPSENLHTLSKEMDMGMFLRTLFVILRIRLQPQNRMIRSH